MRKADGRLAALLAPLLLLALPAQAQSPERPLRWQVNGGYSITQGETRDYLRNGWIMGFGLNWTPRPESPFSLLAELHYSGYDATRELVRIANLSSGSVRIDDGDGDIWGIDVNAVYRVPLGAQARGYVTGGIGEYRRQVRLTQTVLLPGYYCDWWWGYCYGGYVPGDLVVAKQSTTRFAWNAGIGVEFPLRSGNTFFIDARYHQLQTGRSTEIIPIQVGLRF